MMDTNQHWMLQIPMLKVVGITVLLIHIVAIPLFYCSVEYPLFFQNVDFLKMIFLTTAVGVITTSSLIFILFLLMSIGRRKEKNDHKYLFFVLLLVSLNFSFLIGDLFVVLKYLTTNSILTSATYLIVQGSFIFLVGAGSIIEPKIR